jgi:hypothetical protein
MSLTITSQIKTLEGITLEGAYGRVAVVDQFAGIRLQAQVDLYVSEEAFLEGANALHVAIDSISVQPYDRTGMGSDILNIGHDNLIGLLASQGISATKNLK